MASKDFTAGQKEHFDSVERARFCWQTGNALIRDLEALLLTPLNAVSGTVLEVGCGEGANICNLGKYGETLIGLDYSLNRVAYAKTKVGGMFICGDGLNLPFRASSVDAILCRDVIHHLPLEEQATLLTQVHSVLKDGVFVIVEGNPRNPLNWLWSRFNKAEKNLIYSSPARLEALLAECGFVVERKSFFEYFPYRFVFHYSYGVQSLSHTFSGVSHYMDRLLRMIIPVDFGFYCVFVCRKKVA